MGDKYDAEAMSNTKHSIFNWTLTALAVILGLSALISLTTRWLISDIEQYREEIVLQISKTLNLNIAVAEINGYVDFFNPVIYAKQVQLSNPENPTQPLLVEQMEIVIDLPASILHAEPRIDSVQMAGIEVTINTDLEYKLLDLPQIARQWNIPKQFEPAQLLTKTVTMDYFDLGFHDVLIHWNDKNNVNTQTFRMKHFILSRRLYQTQLNLVTELPQTLGQTLTLITTLEHDIDNPAGDFYISTKALKLANAYRLSGKQAIHQGQLQAELWGRASYQHGLENVVGTLSLKDYLNLKLNPNYTISHLKTNVHWQAQKHNRELGLSKLLLQNEEVTVENADVAIVQIQEQENHFTNLRLYADYISPTLYNQLLSYTPTDLTITQHHAKTTKRTQMIDLILQTSHTADWFAVPYRWPPITLPASMTPATLPKPLSGELELTLNDIQVNRGQWTTPQNLEHIEFKGTYKGNAEHSEWDLEHLYIKGSDSHLSGNISYTIKDNEAKLLRASLQLHNLAATEVKQWIPPQTLAPELEHWLHQALRGGTIQSAELTIDGNPDFPFAKDAGLWRLQIYTENLNLLYRTKDPEIKELHLDLLLENQVLKIHSEHLRIMDFYAKDTTVLVEDIAVPYIKINSHGRGPLTNILSYMTTSGLVDSDGILISNIAADGDVNMNLKVHTRLAPTVEQETHIEGYIDLDGTNLKLKTPDLELQQLNGRLYFDKLGGRSDNIKALLNNMYPLTATAEADAGTTLLKMETRIPFPVDYLNIPSLPADTFNTAADTWQIELRIPPLHHAIAQEPLNLKLSSNLKALAVNMPAPFYKARGEIADATLIGNITRTGSDYRLDYGDRMRLILRIPNTGVTTGLLHFSPNIPYPYETNPNHQLIVRGVIPQISINEWIDWQENYPQVMVSPTPYTQDIDVLIEKLSWNASTANDVHTMIKQQTDKTLIALEGAEIKGDVSIPMNQNERVYIDLDHLILDGGFLSSNTHKPDPTTLLPMAIKIDQFKAGDFNIENIKVTLVPITNGVQITKLDFNKSADNTLIQAQLEGNWKRIDEHDYSSFNFLLYSDDYGQLLHDWNFYNGIKGGQGKINGQLTWNSNPFDFELDQLKGPVRLQIKDGAIETIEPGVGRVFGLLNLNVLARRLTLDFKDVFDKGFEFDNMHGSMEFNKANLITQNLDIEGPALDMKISGRTDISQRNYDQKIMITPHVGTNVALATAFLGGPLTAATVFLIGKVTELDNWVDKIITLEYTLKGSWDNPEVKFISNPVTQKLDPANAIKVPGKHIKNIIDKIFSREQ